MFQFKTIKNGFVLLLMALVSLPMLFSMYLFARKQLVRHEMKEKLEQQVLTTIRIHSHDIFWVDAGKEIRVDDKLFDIKSAEQHGEYIIFLGLFDEEEQEIEQEMEKQTEENSSSSTLLKLISHLNFAMGNNISLISSIDGESINTLHSWTEALLNSDSQIDVPPPQV